MSKDGGQGMPGVAHQPGGSAPHTAGPDHVPFYGTHQAGIVTPAQDHPYFAAFDLVTDQRPDMAALLRAWTDAAARLCQGLPAEHWSENPNIAPPDGGAALGLGTANLTITFGFGPDLFIHNGEDRYGLAARRPTALADLPSFSGEELVAAHCEGALSVQASANDAQIAFHAVRQLTRLGDDTTQLRWALDGFTTASRRQDTPRNLMGCKDSTYNPRTPAAQARYVWVRQEGPDWMGGGSYLVCRRIRMDLEHWDRLPLAFQERTFGRRKYSGAPLGEHNEFTPLDLAAKDHNGNPVIPQNAHARLGSPSQNGGSQILRRAYNYTHGGRKIAERWPPWKQKMAYEAGLLFNAYQNDPRTGFTRIFHKMALIDELNQFTTHIGSALFAFSQATTSVHVCLRRPETAQAGHLPGDTGPTKPPMLGRSPADPFLQGVICMLKSPSQDPARRPAGRPGRLFFTLISCALLLCAFSATASAADKAPLTLYAGQHQQLVRMIVSAFEKQTGIPVKVRTGEGPALANQIIEEGKRSPADVYFTENSPELMRLQEKGLLAPVKQSTLAQVPSRDSSPKGDWVGVLARENVLTYNPAMIKASALPRSLLDLAKPKWKGKIAIAPSDADFLPLVRAVVVKDGRGKALQWLQGLKHNAEIYQDDEGVAAAVDKGAVATGIINNYYYYRLRQQLGKSHTHSKLHHFGHHDVGELINISGAGVLKSSAHPHEAQRLLAFMVSKSTQRMVAHSEVDFEYPLHAGVTANKALKPFKQLQPVSISVGQLGDNRQALQLLQRAGLL